MCTLELQPRTLGYVHFSGMSIFNSNIGKVYMHRKCRPMDLRMEKGRNYKWSRKTIPDKSKMKSVFVRLKHAHISQAATVTESTCT